MQKIGIIGGLGPESTVEYYKTIITGFHDRFPEVGYPEIIVYSTNMNEAMAMVTAGQWDRLSCWILDKITSLKAAGAHFVAIASNTPHIVFDRVAPHSPLPLVSIVEATCNAAQSLNLKRCGLLGTASTMRGDFYQEAFSSSDIRIIKPLDEEQKLLHHRIFSEIELGIFNDSTREKFYSIIGRMLHEDTIDGILLACTELPLILTENRFGIPFLNTTAIHCEAILKRCRGAS